MKLIVGLGNPGRRYRETRHNVGFMAVGKLAVRLSAVSAKSQFDGEVAEGRLSGEKVILLCPSTYMNNSGRSVRKAVDYYRLELDDLLVACDDFNLELGQLRLRAKGSGGGQKGLTDIIRVLGSENIARMRIGIGSPPAGWDIPDYVLSTFKTDEKPEIELATDRAALAAEDFVLHGIVHSMNEYNGKY
jgi:PTH1 family peptidyl-tRNA hydrolase